MIPVLSARTVSLVLTALVTLGAVRTATAQSAPLDSPRLSLGISAGAPGADTQVQLTLAGPRDMALRKIDAVVSFADGTLEFQKVAGYLLDSEILKVETREEKPEGGQRKLLVTVTANSDKPLPLGALVSLHFKVTKETKLGVLDVKLAAKVLGLDSKEITPVAVFGGRINIQDPKIFFGCFFYMH